jgi:hypothetical protein
LLPAFAPSSFATSLFALIVLSEIIFEICSSFISILFSSWLYSTNNLGNLSDLILNLDPEENFLVLSFSYVLEYDKYSEFV